MYDYNVWAGILAAVKYLDNSKEDFLTYLISFCISFNASIYLLVLFLFLSYYIYVSDNFIDFLDWIVVSSINAYNVFCVIIFYSKNKFKSFAASNLL
jgi:hypothetical protein